MLELNFSISPMNRDRIAFGSDTRRYVVRKERNGIYFVESNSQRMVNPDLNWDSLQEAQAYACNCEEALRILKELVNLGIRVGDANGEPVWDMEQSLCRPDEAMYVWCPNAKCTAKFLQFTELLTSTFHIDRAVRWDDDTPMEPTLFVWDPAGYEFTATSHPWLRLLFPSF